MPKIAIITVGDHSDYDNEDYLGSNLVTTSITDWTEVSDKEYQQLSDYQRRNETFRVIRRPDNERQFVKDTVKKHLEAAEKDQERIKKFQQEEAARKQKAKLNKEKREKEKFLALKAKFEKNTN